AGPVSAAAFADAVGSPGSRARPAGCDFGHRPAPVCHRHLRYHACSAGATRRDEEVVFLFREMADTMSLPEPGERQVPSKRATVRRAEGRRAGGDEVSGHGTYR